MVFLMLLSIKCANAGRRFKIEEGYRAGVCMVSFLAWRRYLAVYEHTVHRLVVSGIQQTHVRLV